MSTSEIQIIKADKGFELVSEIQIEKPLSEVFDFFSKAENLEYLTPDFLQFKITSPKPIEMKVGALIDYRLKLHGIPFKWRSEITEYSPGVSFVDEQRKGPYLYWKHLHSFAENEQGTLVKDKVSYGVLGGTLVHGLFVKRNLKEIFTYRGEKLAAYFSKP